MEFQKEIKELMSQFMKKMENSFPEYYLFAKPVAEGKHISK